MGGGGGIDHVSYRRGGEGGYDFFAYSVHISLQDLFAVQTLHRLTQYQAHNVFLCHMALLGVRALKPLLSLKGKGKAWHIFGVVLISGSTGLIQGFTLCIFFLFLFLLSVQCGVPLMSSSGQGQGGNSVASRFGYAANA